jgi:hypothetical protein
MFKLRSLFLDRTKVDIVVERCTVLVHARIDNASNGKEGGNECDGDHGGQRKRLSWQMQRVLGLEKEGGRKKTELKRSRDKRATTEELKGWRQAPAGPLSLYLYTHTHIHFLSFYFRFSLRCNGQHTPSLLPSCSSGPIPIQ